MTSARNPREDWKQGAARNARLRMGGIALKNGLILLSERHWAAAIRDKDGGISTASGTKTQLSAGWGESGEVRGRGGLPLLRGLGRFAESLVVMGQVKLKLPEAELPLEGTRVAAALAASLAATSAVRALAPKSALVQEAGAAAAAFVPAVLALKNSPISGYHGAEHKVIGSREMASPAKRGIAGAVPSGYVPSNANRASSAGAAARSAAASKEHERCGSNLVGPFLLATVATNLIVRGRSGRKSPAASAVAGAVSLGAALEILRWASQNGDSIVARLLLLPGRAIQRHLTTTEPSVDQLEVGEAALAELFRLEGISG